MNIINHTSEPLTFMYGDEEVRLQPGEIFPIDGFDTVKLKDVQQLVSLGFVTFYDDEDDEILLPFDLMHNVEKSKRTIVDKSGGVFKSLNFDKVDLENEESPE